MTANHLEHEIATFPGLPGAAARAVKREAKQGWGKAARIEVKQGRRVSVRPALFDDLRIARLLRGTRPVQVFLTVRKRPEFFFQAQVLFAGLR
jgi:hypothetical protein